MSEVLRGNLIQLPLLDILSLLSVRGQTGRLELENGSQTGEIYLNDGNLVHAVTGAHMGEAAIYTLMGWLQGDFNFVPDAAAPEESLTASTEQLLLEGSRRIEEWGDIKKVIPSTNVVFKFSSSGSPGSVNLQPNEWQVLTQVNGAHSVAEIAESMGQDEFTVAKVLYGLSSAGLLIEGEKPAVPPKAIVNGSFFDNLNNEIIEILGPLGPMVIEEMVDALNETLESFPRDKVAKLVERVSAEIDGEDKQQRFQQIILDMFKNL
ncbi:MAG: DUF4388 domain-containing protein [Anaerolineales bacterium]|nr:DUF4388 domain-containing protein [Anaerolineales bacterium]